MNSLTKLLATLIIVPLASVPIGAAILFVFTYNLVMMLAKRFTRHGTLARS